MEANLRVNHFPCCLRFWQYIHFVLKNCCIPASCALPYSRNMSKHFLPSIPTLFLSLLVISNVSLPHHWKRKLHQVALQDKGTRKRILFSSSKLNFQSKHTTMVHNTRAKQHSHYTLTHRIFVSGYLLTGVNDAFL